MGKQAEYQQRKKIQIIDTLKDQLGEGHPMPTSWQLVKVLNRFKAPESMAAAWAEAHTSKTPKSVLQATLQQVKQVKQVTAVPAVPAVPAIQRAKWATAPQEASAQAQEPGVPDGTEDRDGQTPSQTPQGHDCSSPTIHRDLPRHMKLDLVRSILGNLGKVSKTVYESEDMAQVVRLNEILGILQNISEDSGWLSSTRRAIYRKAKELEETES